MMDFALKKKRRTVINYSNMKARTLKKSLIAAMVMASMPMIAAAQDKVEASVGADVVSSYVWRGQDLGGVSIQPGVSLAYKGFSLNAWGSVGFESTDSKEFDLTLGYSAGGFSVSVTDYWCSGAQGYFHYGAHNTAHVFEAQVGYDFGVLSANWYTNFAGADGVNKDGNRAYSSYIVLAAPFKLGGLEWEAEIGATPWATDFYNDGVNGFAVCDIALRAEKEIRVTDSFSLPLFAKMSFNPATEAAGFVVGLTF